MTVREELKAMSITALRARDKETRARLGGILARFMEEEKSQGFAGWSEDLERELVGKYVKQLSGSMAELAGTPLGDSYAAEIALLEPFGPQLLSEAQTRALLEPMVGQVKGIGPLMGRVMKTHRGKVDPALVRALAGELGLL